MSWTETFTRVNVYPPPSIHAGQEFEPVYLSFLQLLTSPENIIQSVKTDIIHAVNAIKYFSKKTPGKNTVRHIQQIWVEKKDNFLIFHVTANSFLWQMVRRIVDCLLKIGQSKWRLEDLIDLLQGTPKPNIHTTVHPRDSLGALILWDVEYAFQFQPDKKSIELAKGLFQSYLQGFSLNLHFSKQIYEFLNLISENMGKE